MQILGSIAAALVEVVLLPVQFLCCFLVCSACPISPRSTALPCNLQHGSLPYLTAHPGTHDCIDSSERRHWLPLLRPPRNRVTGNCTRIAMQISMFACAGSAHRPPLPCHRARLHPRGTAPHRLVRGTQSVCKLSVQQLSSERHPRRTSPKDPRCLYKPLVICSAAGSPRSCGSSS